MKRLYYYKVVIYLLPLWVVNFSFSSPLQSDPIAFAEKTIRNTAEVWTSKEKEQFLKTYTAKNSEGENQDIYLMLESPNMVFDSYLGNHTEEDKGILKNDLVNLLEEIIYYPSQAAYKLALASLNESISEYLIAQKITEQPNLFETMNYDNAIRFLDNRFGYEKAEIAYELLKATKTNSQSEPKSEVSKKLAKKVASIKEEYPPYISVIEALTALSDIFLIMQKENIGIVNYPPYTNFANTLKPINKERTAERIKWRTSLEITYPKSESVWIVPSKVNLKWQTKNMDKDKSIKFFLTRDDVVIQVLGIYKNNGEIDNLVLRSGLPEGDAYKVMGIELYPANKFHIAKFATSYFSIRKERKKVKETEMLVSEGVTVSGIKNDSEVSTVNPTRQTIENIPEKLQDSILVAKSKSTDLNEEISDEVLEQQRILFAGRKISYQKRIVVDSEILTVNLFDHGRQDGDIVSIYLNGKAVIANHILTYQKKSFQIKLHPTKSNDLFLYAHNLGNFPPNTVSLEIKDNSKSEEIVLNSDMQSCEAILIEVKQ